MKLKDILRIKGYRVWSVRSNESLRQALEILVREKIGALLVLNWRGEITGILSERDIVRGCQLNAWDLSALKVEDLMTKGVIVAGPDDDVRDVMAVMTKYRIRHIPVVGEFGLEGMISIGDVVKSTLEESAEEVKHLKDFIFGELAG